MILCDDCLRQCAEELLPNDTFVLFTLNGSTNFSNGLTRSEIYQLVIDMSPNMMKATQINEILKKLEFVGLIKTNNSRKNIIYCITSNGTRVIDMLADKTK